MEVSYIWMIEARTWTPAEEAGRAEFVVETSCRKESATALHAPRSCWEYSGFNAAGARAVAKATTLKRIPLTNGGAVH